jgi:peptidoglycan/LPS O-acetylase OafA/YrhL
MFGGYRFILAILVALSHFGVHGAGLNPGQWAVISFYTLSGVLMERQFRKLSRYGNVARTFYLDRFLRIYPLYLCVLFIGWMAAPPPIPWRETLANVMLLPMNYSYFTGIPAWASPSWSLACEAQFYILVPLLMLCSTKALRILLCASLLFFAGSAFLADSAFWAYTGLPGVLFTFLTGILISRKDHFFIKVVWVATGLLLLAFAATKFAHTGLRTGIHINVALGYLLAVAAITFLDRFSPDVKWDKFFGLFSYPLFLCHWIAAKFVGTHWHISNPLVLLFAGILLSALLIIVIEIPSDHLRYRLRPTKPA